MFVIAPGLADIPELEILTYHPNEVRLAMEYHSNSKSSSRNSNEVCNHNLSTASEISAAKNNWEDIFEDDCTKRTAVWGIYLLVIVTVTVGESRMHLNNPP